MAFLIIDDCIGCGICKKYCPVDAISGEKDKLHVINEIFCIECGTCGRLCVNKAVKDSIGVLCERIKKKKWKKPDFNISICTACRICVDTCPVGCIGLSSRIIKKYPREYPFLADAKACIGCGFCVEDCPVDAIG